MTPPELKTSIYFVSIYISIWTKKKLFSQQITKYISWLIWKLREVLVCHRLYMYCQIPWTFQIFVCTNFTYYKLYPQTNKVYSSIKLHTFHTVFAQYNTTNIVLVNFTNYLDFYGLKISNSKSAVTLNEYIKKTWVYVVTKKKGL